MFGIAIHGGAGTIKRESMTPESEERSYNALKKALYAGYQILKMGGASLEAVEAAVVSMEDEGFFNAGKGAVYTNQGNHELDAAIMCGKTLNAGAVSALKHIKNPVALAKKIMEDDRFVFLTGDGAEEYALLNDIALVPNTYFSTEQRFNQFKLAQEAGVVSLDHSDDKFGTVGAVALDTDGNLAAGTSTGGLTNKVFGRVGDTPIIGAGTYANNASCAISCTGKGELFIKHVVAMAISCLMKYKGLALKEAYNQVFNQDFLDSGGSGGLIGIDKDGHIEMPFNTSGMYRGFISSGKESFNVGIYDEDLKKFETL
jgi:beta-aspartyl-peptidase (threonine type)